MQRKNGTFCTEDALAVGFFSSARLLVGSGERLRCSGPSCCGACWVLVLVLCCTSPLCCGEAPAEDGFPRTASRLCQEVAVLAVPSVSVPLRGCLKRCL